LAEAADLRDDKQRGAERLVELLASFDAAQVT